MFWDRYSKNGLFPLFFEKRSGKIPDLTKDRLEEKKFTRPKQIIMMKKPRQGPALKLDL